MAIVYIHPLIWTYDILQTYEFHMEMTCEGCANAAKRVLGKKGGKPQRHKNILKSEDCMHITKTRLYNFDPLKPHFYIVKLGFTGVYNIFLTFLKNIDCGYLLEQYLTEVVLTSTHNLCFEQKYEKYQNYLKNFLFWL